MLIYLSPEHARAFLDRIADTFPADRPLPRCGRDDLAGLRPLRGRPDRRHVHLPPGDRRRCRGQDAAPDAAAASGRTAARRQSGRARAAGARQQQSRASARPDTSRTQPATAPESGHLGRPTGRRSAQDAIAAGDFGAAVVAFRKCAYLAPHDPVAQLHLGLALDAAGDEPSAQRAYAAARQALLDADPAHSVAGIEGYATAELSGCSTPNSEGRRRDHDGVLHGGRSRVLPARAGGPVGAPGRRDGRAARPESRRRRHAPGRSAADRDLTAARRARPHPRDPGRRQDLRPAGRRGHRPAAHRRRRHRTRPGRAGPPACLRDAAQPTAG